MKDTIKLIIIGLGQRSDGMLINPIMPMRKGKGRLSRKAMGVI